MDLWARYRNLAALGIVVILQLILLGYQVRNDDGLPLVRAWAAGAVTPVASGLNGGFGFVDSLWRGYVWLVGARGENETLKRELDRVRLENGRLRQDLERARRLQRLVDYQREIASETVTAEVIGGGASSGSKEIVLDVGRRDGVSAGMAVLTADGVAGKVHASFASTALVLLINDGDSGMGVVLGGSRVRGVLKGQGGRECALDYVENEVEVRVGEPVFTSGEDRVFPKGLPVGEVVHVEPGADFQQIRVRPFARLDRLDEVLVAVSGVHEPLPSRQPQLTRTLLPPPPPDEDEAATAFEYSASRDEARGGRPGGASTEADRVLERYRAVTAAQGVRAGENARYTPPPNFNAGADAPVLDELGPAESFPADEPAAPADEPLPAPPGGLEPLP